MAGQRRSSRLRGHTPNDDQEATRQLPGYTPSKLEPVTESRTAAQDSPHVQHAVTASSIKTPVSATKPRPASKEMHPAQHQSTSKKAQSANRFGYQASDVSPSKPASSNAPGTQLTTNPFSSPTFDYRFRGQSVELGADAQRIMREVREKADEIRRTQMATHQEEGVNAVASPRKIVQPKRKAGRFSDAHQEAFKKMDSIANHPSSFRADPTRLGTKTGNLKRTNSKADLDGPSSPKKIASSSTYADSSPAKSDRPAKRIKASHNPSDGLPLKMPAKHASSSKLPTISPIKLGTTTLTTPTKASLARSDSVKNVTSASKIPALTRTPSTPKFSLNETAPATEPARNNPPSTFNQRLKSILKQPRIRFSDDPAKLAAGTHVSTPLSARKPTREPTPASPNNRSEKHVNFSASPPELRAKPTPRAPASPSIKTDANTMINAANGSPISSAKRPRATLPSGDFTFGANQPFKFQTQFKPASPTIRRVNPEVGTFHVPTGVKLSELPTIPHGFENKKRKRSEADVGSKHDVEMDVKSAGPTEMEDKENFVTPSSTYPSSPPIGRSADESPKKRIKLAASPSISGKSTSASAARALPSTPSKMTPMFGPLRFSTPKSESQIKTSRPPGMFGAAVSSRTPRNDGRGSLVRGGVPQSAGVLGGKRKGLSVARLNALAAPKKRE